MSSRALSFSPLTSRNFIPQTLPTTPGKTTYTLDIKHRVPFQSYKPFSVTSRNMVKDNETVIEYVFGDLRVDRIYAQDGF